jgi:cytochrome c biogenesis factor
MIPELGHFALILALLVALVQGTLPLAGARAATGLPWIALARPAARAQFLLVALLRLPDLGLRRQRLLGGLRRRSIPTRACR